MATCVDCNELLHRPYNCRKCGGKFCITHLMFHDCRKKIAAMVQHRDEKGSQTRGDNATVKNHFV